MDEIVKCPDCGCASTDDLFGRRAFRVVRRKGNYFLEVCAACVDEAKKAGDS